jgi:hypothetical protein
MKTSVSLFVLPSPVNSKLLYFSLLHFIFFFFFSLSKSTIFVPYSFGPLYVFVPIQNRCIPYQHKLTMDESCTRKLSPPFIIFWTEEVIMCIVSRLIQIHTAVQFLHCEGAWTLGVENEVHDRISVPNRRSHSRMENITKWTSGFVKMCQRT